MSQYPPPSSPGDAHAASAAAGAGAAAAAGGGAGGRGGTRLDRWLSSYAERTSSMTASEIRALFSVANRLEVVYLAGGMPNLAGLSMSALSELAHEIIVTRGTMAYHYGSCQG